MIVGLYALSVRRLFRFLHSPIAFYLRVLVDSYLMHPWTSVYYESEHFN